MNLISSQRRPARKQLLQPWVWDLLNGLAYVLVISFVIGGLWTVFPNGLDDLRDIRVKLVVAE